MRISAIILAVLVIHNVCGTLNESPESSEEHDIVQGDDSQEEYGEILSKIIGGKKIGIHKAPYTAAVIQKTKHFASAIVLNKRWLLTSAWVLYLEDKHTMLIRTGSNSAIYKGQTRWVDQVYVHPNYSQTWNNDVGLIKLKKPLHFNRYTQPIRIANKIHNHEIKAKLTGFGLTKSSNDKTDFTVHNGWLRMLESQTISNKECKEYYQSSKLYSNANYCLKPSNNAGPCSYDNGSPLVFKRKLIGTFSGVPTCQDEQFPPVFTDVTRYKKWITDTIKKNSKPDEYEEFYKEIQYYY